MSRPIYFVVPGPLTTRTGGYIYDRRIVAGLRALGRSVEVVELGGSYPFPSPRDREHACTVFSGLPDGARVVVDGLAFGALPDLAESQHHRLRVAALIHHPLADETGLDAQLSSALALSETRALATAHRVIVTSAFTAARLGAFGVGASGIAVVIPGTDTAALAHGSGGRNVMLCPASLIPRKGHRDLFQALAGLIELNWRLVCVGKSDSDPACASEIRELRASLGLGQRIEVREEVGESELARLYDGTDLLVLASHYEGFGMVVQEAVARGIPIVATSGGALAETVPRGAGLTSPPGDIGVLRENLRRALSDRGTYLALTEGARRARTRLPTWRDAAVAFDTSLRGLA